MKKIFTFLVFVFIIGATNEAFAQFPTIYATRASGSWNSTGAAGIWETYVGNATNTPTTLMSSSPTSVPSGTHYVYVRAGHTITMDNTTRNVMGMTVEATGKVISATAGGATTLKPAMGTSGSGPNNFGIINNGTIGQASDAIVLEIPTTAGTVDISGTGVYLFSRMRMAGGNTFSPILNFNANATFSLTGNYAFSAVYNPNAADNYTVNIAAGKTVTLSGIAGAFNNNALNSGTGFGTYTYNINGILDLTASTASTAGGSGGSSLSAVSPSAGTVNLNIGSAGIIKTGVTFNSVPTATGIANLSIASGGIFDASLASYLLFTGSAFSTAGTAKTTRTVPTDGSIINFPVKSPGGNISPASISRTAGAPGVFSVNVQNTFDNPPSAPTQCVQKQWNISTTGAAFASDVVTLSWVTADEGSAFDHNNPNVKIGHYTAGAYEYKPATVTGTGTAADPYVASASGFTSYSPFIVTNLGVLPLSLTSFNAVYNGKTTDLRWVTENEVNVRNFDIEKSTDGIKFSSIASKNANNNSNNNYQFTDAAALKGSAYYRLKMNDIDGKFTYSRIVSVRASVKEISLSIYPNPAQEKVTVSHGITAENASLNIFSADGKMILTQKITKGSTATTVDLSRFKPGNYTVSVADENGKGTSTFIKQ